MSEALEQLAAYVGILPSYVGFDGTPVHTSTETRRAILESMGLRAESAAAAREQLAALQDDDLREPLDPVVVHQHGQENKLIVRAPRRAGAVRWRIDVRSERGRVASREGLYDTSGPLEIETPDFGAGYYDVRLRMTSRRAESEVTQLLVVAPERCTVPRDLLGERKAVGVYANLYSIRGDRNWGVGDVGDLETLSRWVASVGGSFVGLNPLHALLNRGGDVSPYGPVTRLWRNPIYIDIDRIPEFCDPQLALDAANELRTPEIEAALGPLRESSRVEYQQAWAMKSLALDRLFSAFMELRSRHATHARVTAFNKFVDRGGHWLDDYATWMAIAESRNEWTWKMWPAELQERGSEAVKRFAAEHSRRVDFHKWAQFELDRQLGEVADACRANGMEIGLYQDLAVGSSGTGSDAWAQRQLFRDGVTIGAPPDPYSDFGQNWGLPPIDPRALRRNRYRYFIQLVRGGFRHAGALRMDHVMGLFRLFWIPEGATGRDGAYVRYPADELLGILALESQRHKAIVVGEDLGVVPPEVPSAMHRWGILSSKVLYFEREDGGGFKPQSSYPELSLASVNTHDMPTIAGFWTGRDVELRRSLGLVDEKDSATVAAERDHEKRKLLDRLRDDAALPLHEHPPLDTAGVPIIKRGLHDFLCNAPSALLALSLDDLGDEHEPINVPGVGTDKYPCWSRKMHKTIPEIAALTGDELARCAARTRPR
jgi:4-alpha-glucanotransferase